MSDFLFSINATVPIFLVILLGWFLKRIGLINDEFPNIANKYVFKVSLPVLLFRDIATTSVLKDVNMKFVAFVSSELLLCLHVHGALQRYIAGIRRWSERLRRHRQEEARRCLELPL